MISAEERFWKKVDRSDVNGCWLWLGGGNDKDNYGTIFFRGKNVRAHRFAFFLANGRMPEPFGCHSCDNPPCVRPDHIFEGTPKQNSQDMARKGRNSMHQTLKTECPHGHPYSAKNTSVETTRRGRKRRHCRTCMAARTETCRKRRRETLKKLAEGS